MPTHLGTDPIIRIVSACWFTLNLLITVFIYLRTFVCTLLRTGTSFITCLDIYLYIYGDIYVRY